MTNQVEVNGLVYATDDEENGLYLYKRRGKWQQLVDSDHFSTKTVKCKREKIKRYVKENIL